MLKQQLNEAIIINITQGFRALRQESQHRGLTLDLRERLEYIIYIRY